MANLGDPVTFARSPMFMKFESGRNERASRPLNRSHGSTAGGTRGGTPRTAAAMARMWSGVEPQQPPTMLSQPLEAKSRRSRLICSGVSSNPPNAFGRPALG